MLAAQPGLQEAGDGVRCREGSRPAGGNKIMK